MPKRQLVHPVTAKCLDVLVQCLDGLHECLAHEDIPDDKYDRVFQSLVEDACARSERLEDRTYQFVKVDK